MKQYAGYQEEYNVWIKRISAEEDNWDNDTIQSINSNKKKGDNFHVTLFVNTAPIKLIINSGSLVTLIPQCFNSKSKVEKINTYYEDVNDNKFEFVGPRKAAVKTINTTPITVTIYKSKRNAVNWTGLDETARNNKKLEHRCIQDPQHKNG